MEGIGGILDPASRSATLTGQLAAELQRWCDKKYQQVIDQQNQTSISSRAQLVNKMQAMATTPAGTSCSMPNDRLHSKRWSSGPIPMVLQLRSAGDLHRGAPCLTGRASPNGRTKV